MKIQSDRILISVQFHSSIEFKCKIPQKKKMQTRVYRLWFGRLCLLSSISTDCSTNGLDLLVAEPFQLMC